MAKRKIVETGQKGEEILRKISKPVEVFDESIAELFDDMVETLTSTPMGAGLSAVQVGVLKRVFIMVVDDKKWEFANPKIVSASRYKVVNEGCLSVPNKYGKVKRPMRVTVEAQDRHGNPFSLEFEKFHAQVISHECDHLDGKLYVDFIQGELLDAGN